MSAFSQLVSILAPPKSHMGPHVAMCYKHWVQTGETGMQAKLTLGFPETFPRVMHATNFLCVYPS